MAPSDESKPPPLQRGKACYACRRRKMKCDGVHPICGQCARVGKEEDCEYTHGQRRARAEILQESISQVESRIYELEHPTHQRQASVVLHAPYQPGTTEPPADIIQRLVDSFLLYSSEVGFFLNASRFRRSALLHHPIGHPARPAPALMAAVSLWGLRLADQPSVGSAQEPAFLARAVALTAKSLSVTHPERVMHTLQAEVLLAYYFFACGRLLEGKYHSAAAVSLSLSSRLHLSRSGNNPNPGPPLFPGQDAVDEGERVLACWIVIILDNAWAVTLGEGPHLDYDRQSAALDVPWPLEMHDYERGRFHPNILPTKTLYNFLNGVPSLDTGTSTIAILAKAALLWQRADSLARDWRPDLPPVEATIFEASVAALDIHIDSFRAALIPPSRIPNPTPAMTRALVVADSIAHTATVRLHRIPLRRVDAGAHNKCITAASTVLNILISVPLRHLEFINPIMGTVWLVASQALIDELSVLRHKNGSRARQAATNLTNLLTRALDILPSFARTCPFLSPYFPSLEFTVLTMGERLPDFPDPSDFCWNRRCMSTQAGKKLCVSLE
ncbi:hypothetical protein C8R46DRAFT_880063 [Mycena filopes]|nr:hypothetical protein C8R46DRAFT_880063 [Mycena filopes]